MDQADRRKALGMESVLVRSSYTFTLPTLNTWLRLYLSLDEKRSNHFICIYSSHSDKMYRLISLSAFTSFPFKLKGVRKI